MSSLARPWTPSACSTAKAADALAAIGDADKKIAVISATPANLKTLAANLDKLKAFWQRGGTLVLRGLTPEGLADYNRIVGVDHVIRPFKRERVTFPAVRNPLTAGLTTGDIVMLSGQRIFGWTADEYVASDVFTLRRGLRRDRSLRHERLRFGYDNMINGFVGSDGWPLIIDFEHPKDGKPYEIKMDLPHEETIVEYTHDQSVNYNPTDEDDAALRRQGPRRVRPARPMATPQTFADRSAAQGPARHRCSSSAGSPTRPSGRTSASTTSGSRSSASAGVAGHRQADAEHRRRWCST